MDAPDDMDGRPAAAASSNNTVRDWIARVRACGASQHHRYLMSVNFTFRTKAFKIKHSLDGRVQLSIWQKAFEDVQIK